MHVVIACKDHEFFYIGPFPSLEMAYEYGNALTEEYKWYVSALIAPYAKTKFEAVF